LWRIPLVLEVNAPLALEKETYEKLAFPRLAYAAERWICSRSSATIVVSTRMREILAAQGVPWEHMNVISNGVDLQAIQAALGTIDVRERYELGDKLVLGFVGWFKPWHRLDAVLHLLAAHPAWLGRVHVLLVGDGPEAEPLRCVARELGLEAHVTITGAVSHQHVFDYIDAFDIALQPHVTEYASPMKIFEYLALGKCVVAPDLPNIREILSPGEDALLFRAGDAADMARAIEELAQDPQRVRAMGGRARAKIDSRQYTWVENARRALRLVGLEPPVPALVPETLVV
jgi:glycosyltransferase involved in cell wall biosynthesis